MSFDPSNSVSNEAFAELLRRLRRSAGLTQQDLAERAGVSLRTVSDLERGINHRPQRDTAVMLADGLDLTGRARDQFRETARRRASGTTRTNLLSLSATEPMVGRDREMAEIVARLRVPEVRLLTLTGPGGVGKTRLAIEAATVLARSFADGVLFVRLESLTDPTQVVAAIASALQLQERGDRPLLDQVNWRLAGREVLMVLDNLEHLLPAATDLVEIVARAPGLTLLVTSREPLRVRGEQVMLVAPLPRPERERWHREAPPSLTGEPAMQLFVNRLRNHRPTADIDPQTPAGRANLEAIAALCAELDGFPLAIELAAAQSDVLSPVALLSLFRSGGLSVLSGGRRDAPPRQQTMDAAMEWSYSRLSVVEQEVFRALGVFSGGFTLAAAARVFDSRGLAPGAEFGPRQQSIDADSEAIGAIGALLRRSLIVEEATVAGAHPRFRMLEPIRLFARDRLRRAGDEEALLHRHAAYFAALAESLDTLILGPTPERWLPELEIELANMRAAIDWAQRADQTELAARLVCFVAQLWEIKGNVTEGRQRVAAAIAGESGIPTALRWFLRFWAGIFAFDIGNLSAAAEHAAELLRIAEGAADATGVGVGLALLSRVAGAGGKRRDEAAELAQRAVDTLAPLGHDEWTGWAWSRFGIEQHRRGQLAVARDALLTGLAMRRRRESAGGVSYSLVSLGAVLADLDQPVAARDAYLECLELAVRHQNQTLSVTVLTGIADLLWRHGGSPVDRQSALTVYGAAEGIRERHGIGRDLPSQAAIDAWLKAIRDQFDDRDVVLLIDRGRAASPLELSVLVRTADLFPGGTVDSAPKALLCSLASSE